MSSLAPPHMAPLIPNLENGGSERQAVLLALLLRRGGYDVTVVAMQGGGAFAAELIQAEVPLFYLGSRGAMEYLAAVPRLLSLLRRKRIDLIYSFLPPANVLASLAGIFVANCHVAWSMRSADMPLAGYGLKSRLAYAAERLLARFPHRIIVNSKVALEACIDNGFNRQRLKVVHNGFDTESFRPDAEARRRLRAEFAARTLA